MLSKSIQQGAHAPNFAYSAINKSFTWKLDGLLRVALSNRTMACQTGFKESEKAGNKYCTDENISTLRI